MLYSENVLLDKITYKYFRNKSIGFNFKEQVKYYLFPFIRKIKKDLYYSEKEYQIIKREEKLNNLKRVDYIGSSFEEEKQIQSKILKFDRPLFDFWYYPLEVIVDMRTEINLNKGKVLIGHSGFSNGNHLDVVYKIKNYNLSNVEVIIPFSYGEKKYMEIVKKEIASLKINVKFLEDFMPLSLYSGLLNDVKIAVFNNRRQQAIGNIITLIYFGSKVFLSEKNTFYQFLKRQNVLVYNYEKELNDTSINVELTENEMIFNQQKMIELFSEKKLLNDLKESLEKVAYE
ncbi:TDP-N-acetylfucosamine:lipid II N-acetylfucosaminyltransferase [Empedobacter brevis]|uniref:TDP-N-acetylfucosamine:lipid II N-acetylfucosaminyltransferase n=1 Tax=Empedobacter brevis TaxID=247 RepID=UPI002FE01FA1